MDLPEDWSGMDRIQKMKHCVEQADEWLIKLSDVIAEAETEPGNVVPTDAINAGAEMAQAWLVRATWARDENL